MKPIALHTVPSTVFDRLAQDVIVSRLQPNGRFVDTYVADLVDGDQFYVPEKELPTATDTEILDFVIKNQKDLGWIISPDSAEPDGTSTIVYFERSGDLATIAERKVKTGDTPALLGSFREVVTELIDNQEL